MAGDADLAQLQNFLLVGAILFGIGMTGFLTRRNMIVMFLCAEMMLQAVALNLVAFSWYHGDFGGQMLVVFIITVAACEAAISLALVMTLFRKSGTLDMVFWQKIREENVPAFEDEPLPPQAEDRKWPHLTPAGVEPKPSSEEESEELQSTYVR